MAQHKAPTAVTIARTEEGSAFTEWVERYWKLGAAILAIGAGALLFVEYRKNQTHQVRGASWSQVMEVAQSDGAGLPRGDPAALQALAVELSGTDAAPWALYLASISALNRREYDVAQTALNDLRTTYPDHPLVATPYPFGEGAAPETIPDHLESVLAGQRAWERDHPSLFDNQAPPADAPRVRLVTDAGPILLSLYPEKAPKHVENFLKLCGEGFYDGLAFHRVIAGFMIQAGDPNTKDEDTKTWGQGGPGYNVEAEQNDLRHFPGYLSAAKKQGEAESSGSQFFISTMAAHHLDGLHVVYGKVLEGMESVRAIEAGATVQGSDIPINPVRIISTEVL